MLPMPEDADHVIALLEDAGRTLMCQHVPGCRPAGMRSWWPPVVQAYEDAYGYTAADLPPPLPSAREVSAMDRAHDWIRLIPLDRPRRGSGDLWSRHGGAQLRRVVWLRSLVNPRTGRLMFSWKRLGDALGCSHEAVRQWHARGIDIILGALHRQAAPPAPIVITTPAVRLVPGSARPSLPPLPPAPSSRRPVGLARPRAVPARALGRCSSAAA
jgi:hypothetical protein